MHCEDQERIITHVLVHAVHCACAYHMIGTRLRWYNRAAQAYSTHSQSREGEEGFVAAYPVGSQTVAAPEPP